MASKDPQFVAKRDVAVDLLIVFLTVSKHTGCTSWSWKELDASVKGEFATPDLVKSDKFMAFAAENQLEVRGEADGTGLRVVPLNCRAH